MSNNYTCYADEIVLIIKKLINAIREDAAAAASSVVSSRKEERVTTAAPLLAEPQSPPMQLPQSPPMQLPRKSVETQPPPVPETSRLELSVEHPVETAQQFFPPSSTVTTLEEEQPKPAAAPLMQEPEQPSGTAGEVQLSETRDFDSESHSVELLTFSRDERSKSAMAAPALAPAPAVALRGDRTERRSEVHRQSISNLKSKYDFGRRQDDSLRHAFASHFKPTTRPFAPDQRRESEDISSLHSSRLDESLRYQTLSLKQQRIQKAYKVVLQSRAMHEESGQMSQGHSFSFDKFE
eukprot:TRINITY_DN4955_c0_g1_i6.p2 TRINITY_DN4955_c0_g1~~TRINITY_DN4955_c0_g1_i6.p2  ORF type:complete len:295 (+),score=79.15 TRINITY_DN4955_c0_g1_i6:814-1698(+)